jgi:hypothetical protein
VQFGLVVDVHDQAPEVLTTEIIESVRNTDPKSIAEMIGGSKDGAEKLGLVYRKPSRLVDPNPSTTRVRGRSGTTQVILSLGTDPGED